MKGWWGPLGLAAALLASAAFVMAWISRDDRSLPGATSAEDREAFAGAAGAEGLARAAARGARRPGLHPLVARAGFGPGLRPPGEELEPRPAAAEGEPPAGPPIRLRVLDERGTPLPEGAPLDCLIRPAEAGDDSRDVAREARIAEGLLAVPSPWRGRVELVLEAPGYGRWRGVIAADPPADAPVSIRLDPGRVLAGSIVFEGEAPAEFRCGVALEGRGGEIVGSSRREAEPGARRFRFCNLPEGPLELRVTNSRGHLLAASEAALRSREDLTVVVPERAGRYASLRGRILDRLGGPGTYPQVVLRQEGNPCGQRTGIDEEGRFVFEDLPPGNWTLLVWDRESSLPDGPLALRLGPEEARDLGEVRLESLGSLGFVLEDGVDLEDPDLASTIFIWSVEWDAGRYLGVEEKIDAWGLRCGIWEMGSLRAKELRQPGIRRFRVVSGRHTVVRLGANDLLAMRDQ